MKTSLFACLSLAAISISCRQVVDPGHVGVIVSLSGDQKGVHEKVVGVGKYYIGWNEELYLFPTFTKTYNWTKEPSEGSPQDESISFQTKEGTEVNGDFGITMGVVPDQAAILFQKYRRTVDEIIDSVLRNAVRDALIAEASSMGVEEIISSGKVVLIAKATDRVKASVAASGIRVEKISTLGKFRLPANIETAINSKIQATQDAITVENQMRQTKAEAMKTIAAATAQGEAKLAQARAEAQANRLLSESLSPSLIEKMRIERWNGVMPVYSGSVTPMIQMK